MSRAFAGLLAAALLWAAGGSAQEAQEPVAVEAATEAELEALREAIDERRTQVEAYERQEQSLFDAVAAVDEAARAVRREVARARESAAAAAAELVRLEGEREAIEARFAATQQALSRRAVSLYKAGEIGPLRMVFAPGSLRDRLARIQALQLLVDHDRALLDRTAEERAAVERARVDARIAAERRDEAEALLDRRRVELEAERHEKRRLLQAVRRDKVRERALLNDLEAAAAALEEKLAELLEDPSEPVFPEAVPFAERRGNLDPPVPGRILRGFGRVVDAEFRTETFRKGIDFEVERGEPVRAVAPGTVRYAGRFSGYGLMIILDQGGGWFTVSGHLEEVQVEVGDLVREGDALGAAGETGSLSGPRLYFEIRQGAEAQDPRDWLRLVPDL